MELSDLDKQVLTRIQAGFPIESRPYAAVGESLGVGESDVLASVDAMRGDEGHPPHRRHLRQPPARVPLHAVRDRRSARACRRGRGVHLGLPERHAQLPSRGPLHRLVHAHRAARRSGSRPSSPRSPPTTGIDDILDLPAIRLFKIRVDFDLTGERAGTVDAPPVDEARGDARRERSRSTSRRSRCCCRTTSPPTEHAFRRPRRDASRARSRRRRGVGARAHAPLGRHARHPALRRRDPPPQDGLHGERDGRVVLPGGAHRGRRPDHGDLPRGEPRLRAPDRADLAREPLHDDPRPRSRRGRAHRRAHPRGRRASSRRGCCTRSASSRRRR